MNYRKPLITFALFMIVSIMATWMVYGTLQRDVPGETNSYSAMFTDVSGLLPGADVRAAGVRVGRVDSVDLQGNLARVTFRVQRPQALFTDTVASVKYQNIIGQRYLGLSPGPGSERQKLPAHGRIPVEHTEPSFDITYLLRGFEPLFSLLDPEQVDSLTAAIIEALQGENGTVLSLITQTSALAELVAGPDDLLGQVITNLNTVVKNLSAQNNNLGTVIDQTRVIMSGLNSRRDELRDSVGSIGQTVERLAEITDNVFPALHELAARQPGFTTNLVGSGRDRFAFFGANLPYLLKGLARMTQSGTYGDIYACDVESSMFRFLTTLIPSVVRAATPDNTIKHSPVCR